jgi:hypothetical protein
MKQIQVTSSKIKANGEGSRTWNLGRKPLYDAANEIEERA